LLQGLALRLAQLRGHVHAHACQQVALAAALEPRRAAALDAEQLPVGRAGRDLELDAALGRRDLDRRAERGLVEVDGNLEHEVVAAPLVELRRLDPRDDVEVACGRAAVAGLALPLELDLRAVLHAGGDADREPLRPPLAAGSPAGRARRLDDRPHPAATRARL